MADDDDGSNVKRPAREAVKGAAENVFRKDQATTIIERIQEVRKTDLSLDTFISRNLTKEGGWFDKQRGFFSQVNEKTGLTPGQQRKVFDLAFNQAFQTFSPEQRQRIDSVIGDRFGGFASMSSNRRVDILSQALTEGKERGLLLRLINRGRRAMRPTSRHFAAHYGPQSNRPNYIPSTLGVEVMGAGSEITALSSKPIGDPKARIGFDNFYEGMRTQDPALASEFETFVKGFQGGDYTMLRPNDVAYKGHTRMLANDPDQAFSRFEVGFWYRGSDFTLRVPTLRGAQGHIGYTGDSLNVRRIMNPVGVLDPSTMKAEEVARNVFFMKRVNEELLPRLQKGNLSAREVRDYIKELHDIFGSQEVSSGRAYSSGATFAQQRYEKQRAAAMQLFVQGTGPTKHGVTSQYNQPLPRVMLAALKANPEKFGIDISETRFEAGMVGYMEHSGKMKDGTPITGDMAYHEVSDYRIVERARLDQKIRNRTMAPEAVRAYLRPDSIQQMEFNAAGLKSLYDRIDEIAKRTGTTPDKVAHLKELAKRKNLGQPLLNQINYDLKMAKQAAAAAPAGTQTDKRFSILESNIYSAQERVDGAGRHKLFTNYLTPQELALYGMVDKGDKRYSVIDDMSMISPGEVRYHEMLGDKTGTRLENARGVIQEMGETLEGAYKTTPDGTVWKSEGKALERRSTYLAGFKNAKTQYQALEDAGYLLAQTKALPNLSGEKKASVEADVLKWLNLARWQHKGLEGLTSLNELVEKEDPDSALMQDLRKELQTQERPLQLQSLMVDPEKMTGDHSKYFGSGEGVMDSGAKPYLSQRVTQNKILATLNPEAFEQQPGSAINENRFTAGGFVKDSNGQYMLRKDLSSGSTILGWDTKGRAVEWDRAMMGTQFFEVPATDKDDEPRRLVHMEYDTVVTPESHAKIHGDDKLGVSFAKHKGMRGIVEDLANMMPGGAGRLLREQLGKTEKVSAFQWGEGKKAHRHIRQMMSAMHGQLDVVSRFRNLNPSEQAFHSEPVAYTRGAFHLGKEWEGTTASGHYEQVKKMMSWYVEQGLRDGRMENDPTLNLLHRSNLGEVFGLVESTFGREKTLKMIDQVQEEMTAKNLQMSQELIGALQEKTGQGWAAGATRAAVGDPMAMQGSGKKGTMEGRAMGILTTASFGERGEEVALDFLKRMRAHDIGPEGEGKWRVSEELQRSLKSTIEPEKVGRGASVVDLSETFDATDMEKELTKKLQLARGTGDDVWLKLEGGRGIYVPSAEVTGMSSDTIESTRGEIRSSAELENVYRNFIRDVADKSGSTLDESIQGLQKDIFHHATEFGKGMGGALRGRLPGSSFLTATSRSDLGEIIGTGNIVGVSETAADRMFEEMMSSGVYDDEQIGRLQGQLDELKQGKEIGGVVGRHPFIGAYSLMKTRIKMIKDPGDVVVVPEINVKTSKGSLKLGAMLGLAGDYDFDSLIVALLDPTSERSVRREMDFSVEGGSAYAQAYLNHQIRYQTLDAIKDVSAGGVTDTIQEQAAKNLVKAKYVGQLSNQMSEVKFFAQSYRGAQEAAEVYALAEWLEQKPISSKHASAEALDIALEGMLAEFKHGTDAKGLERAILGFIDPKSEGLGDIILSQADADEIEKGYGMRPTGTLQEDGGILIRGFDIEKIAESIFKSRVRATKEGLDYTAAMLKGKGGRSSARAFAQTYMSADKGLGAAISTVDNVVSNLMSAVGQSGITHHKGIVAAMAVGSLFGLNATLSQPREMVGPGKHLDSRARMNMSKATKRLRSKDIKPPRAPIGAPTGPNMLAQRRAMIAAQPRETNHYLVRARVNYPEDVGLISQQLQQFTSMGNSVNISVRDSRRITNVYADSNKRY